MSEHTKKHPINAHAHGSVLYISHRQTTYAIPRKIVEKYIVENPKTPGKVKKSKQALPTKFLLDNLDKKYTKAGALLKGLRLREGLSQIEFAKKINVTQANLSNMENGKRPIGKIIAKRIEKTFGTNYRYFLE